MWLVYKSLSLSRYQFKSEVHKKTWNQWKKLQCKHMRSRAALLHHNYGGRQLMNIHKWSATLIRIFISDPRATHVCKVAHSSNTHTNVNTVRKPHLLTSDKTLQQLIFYPIFVAADHTWKCVLMHCLDSKALATLWCFHNRTYRLLR